MAGGLKKFVDRLHEEVPLRNALEKTWTDYISEPYAPCPECKAIGNKKQEPEGTIGIYDLVQLAEIVKENKASVTDIAHKFEKVLPYLQITACEPHLIQAITECFLGTFEYHETGKDGLNARVHSDTLIHIELPSGIFFPSGISYVKLSYPLHPLLEENANLAKGIFLDLKVGNFQRK